MNIKVENVPSATLKPIINEPALIFSSKNSNVLCVADVHIGYEIALGQAGFRIPSQTGKLIEKLYNLTRKVNAKKLIILGDVKHGVASFRRELRECELFLTEVSSFVDVEIIRGNHDFNIEKFLPENVVLHSSRGVLLQECNTALIHGHAWPKPELLQAEQIVMGHNHPVVEFRDVSGARWLKPVWMEIQLDRIKVTSQLEKTSFPPNGLINILVMPAFNPLLGGTPINTDTELLGPLLSSKLINTNDISLTLPDATYLGKLGELRRCFEGFPHG
ncbi:MAG: metallophosphoesterase [Candidatus Jordarchaeales archaeon]